MNGSEQIAERLRLLLGAPVRMRSRPANWTGSGADLSGIEMPAQTLTEYGTQPVVAEALTSMLMDASSLVAELIEWHLVQLATEHAEARDAVVLFSQAKDLALKQLRSELRL